MRFESEKAWSFLDSSFLAGAGVSPCTFAFPFPVLSFLSFFWGGAALALGLGALAGDSFFLVAVVVVVAGFLVVVVMASFAAAAACRCDRRGGAGGFVMVTDCMTD